MAEVIFGLQSYESASLPLSAQRMLNCYFERQPQGAKSQTPIFGSPGLSLFTTLPTQPIRGLWPFQGQIYAVGGDSLYRINQSGGYKLLGAGISGSGVVSMSNNTTQLGVVNGVGGWIVDINDNYQQITDPEFPSANTLLFFDEYFLVDVRETNEFQYSQLANGLTWPGLNFASAEAKPGFTTALKENLRLLFIFCQNHLEMWYDSGAQTNPFQPYAGGVIERGCVSPAAIVNQDDALFFLGVDRVFYRLQGNVPVRVSTHGVEKAIQGYGDISDASAFTYTWRGHKMVHLDFPSAPHTWVYDISTGMWHERDSRDSSNRDLGRWRGQCAVEIYNKVIVGDAFSGALYYLDADNYTENGNVLQFLAHSAPIHQDKLRVYIDRLELDMEQGTAPATGQGSAPQVLLRWSKDGGRTWSRVQPSRSLGTAGQTLARQRWISLGQAYQWVFEVAITDPVKRVLIATHLDAEAGMP